MYFFTCFLQCAPLISGDFSRKNFFASASPSLQSGDLLRKKFEKFSIFRFPPLSGACAAPAPDSLRVGWYFFRKKTHVAIWKTVWYGICKKVYPRGISVQKNP